MAEMQGTARVTPTYRATHGNPHVVIAVVRMTDPADGLSSLLRDFSFGTQGRRITHRVEYNGAGLWRGSPTASPPPTI